MKAYNYKYYYQLTFFVILGIIVIRTITFKGLHMKIDNYKETLPLTGETIDKISEKTQSLLISLNTEMANILRIRLSIEEALLRFLDKFGENAFITVNMGKSLRRPFISIELEGEPYNPMASEQTEFDTWSDSLLNDISITPEYSYNHGINTVILKLKQPSKSPAISLVTAILVGIAGGMLGKSLLSPEIQADVVKTVLQPVNDVFFRLLNAVSGPVIFLTVVVAICGMGSVASIGKTGRRMVVRFILSCFLITVFSCIVSIPFFRLDYVHNSLTGTEFSSFLDLFLNIIPNDIFMPFIKGESPQLILMGFVLGNALLVTKGKSERLTEIFEQTNRIGLIIAGWLGRLVPYFVALLLILEIWIGSPLEFVGIWKPISVFLLISVAIMLTYISYVCAKKGIKFSKFIKKIYPSFMTALKSASVEYAFGENELCCEKNLGISKTMASSALPLGLIMFMPAASISMLAFTMYAAEIYGISVSVSWYIFAIILTTIVVVAEPPVPGVTLLGYAAVFSQLHIPVKALAVAMVANIIFSFFISAFNQAMLQTELVLQADKAGMLNTEILRK